MHTNESLHTLAAALDPAIARPNFEVKFPGAQLPPEVIADLRTDHAGEVGAVYIYKAILTISRDPNLREFAEHHLATELTHLQRIKEWLPSEHYSSLTPIWKLAGFLTGVLPALFGPSAVYATIESVETFVDHHYEEQVQALASYPELTQLRQVLQECQADEVQHRDEARASKGNHSPGLLLRLWCALVSWGSQNAVVVSRYI
jgi:3-demethoxyubiquinol 3-hydroxylase